MFVGQNLKETVTLCANEVRLGMRIESWTDFQVQCYLSTFLVTVLSKPWFLCYFISVAVCYRKPDHVISASYTMEISERKKNQDGVIAQLVDHRTVTPLTQVRFPGAAREFFSQSQLSMQTLLRCPYNPVRNHMHLHLCTR